MKKSILLYYILSGKLFWNGTEIDYKIGLVVRWNPIVYIMLNPTEDYQYT